MFGRAHRYQLSMLLLATLLLRASIPDGYMPAPLGTGVPFMLCPAGVSAGFMAALTGSEHHRHHGTEGTADSRFEANECPIGHMLAPAAAIDDHWADTAMPRPFEFAALPDAAIVSATPVKARSRGPPA